MLQSREIRGQTGQAQLVERKRLSEVIVMKHEHLDSSVRDELIRHVIEFHGHLGPFLVLGVKAGLLANSILGKDCFKTTAVVMTDPSPPNSCFVDGVQFTTGCTMGKCNIRLKKGKDLTVLFTKEDRKLSLKLKKEVMNSIRCISSEEESKKESLTLFNRSASELFEIEE